MHLSKSATPCPRSATKVSVKDRPAAKKSAGNVFSSNDKRALVNTKNVVKSLSASFSSSQSPTGFTNCERQTTPEKAADGDVENEFASPQVTAVNYCQKSIISHEIAVSSTSDVESVATGTSNEGANQDRQNPTKISRIQQIDEPLYDVIPSNTESVLQSSESRTSFREENLQEYDSLRTTIAADDNVFSGARENIEAGCNFEPANILITDGNLNRNEREQDLDMLIAEMKSGSEHCHAQREMPLEAPNQNIEEVSWKCNYSKNAEGIFSKDLDLAIAIIDAARMEALKASDMHTQAKQVMDAVLTVVVKDLVKFSPVPKTNSLNKIALALLSAVSIAVISFAIIFKPRECFLSDQPPPT